MPRPRSLTPPAIAAAALAVIDRDGLAGLSMRAVAGELGVGVMSLYRYVEGREELERLVVDRVVGGLDLRLPAGASWERRVTILAERVREAVGAHAGVVPLLLAHRHATEGSWRFGEALLGVLAEGGFGGRQRVIAFRSLMSYVLGALQYQQLGALSGAGTAALARLPRGEYPLLTETARAGGRVGAGEEFRRGLEVVLRGLRGGGGKGGATEDMEGTEKKRSDKGG